MGDGEVNGERGEVAGQCPECGTARSERTPAVPWLVRRLLLVKLAALLLVLGFVVIQNVRTWPVMDPPLAIEDGDCTFPTHRYTRADLEAYASGAVVDDRLIDDLFDDLTLGSQELAVGFLSPIGDCAEATWYGWPSAIASYWWWNDYNDVYAKTNPDSMFTGLAAGWHGLSYVSTVKDEGGRMALLSFRVQSLGMPLLLVAVSWSVGRIARFVLVGSKVCDRDQSRVRDRWVRRLPALFALMCVIGVTAASLQQGSESEPHGARAYYQSFDETGLLAVDLERMRNDPDAGAKVAIAILEAADHTRWPLNGVLAFNHTAGKGGTTSEGMGGWPAVSWYYTTRQTGWAENVASRWPSLSFRRVESDLVVTARWGDPLERYDTLELSLESLGLIGLMLYGAWWVVSFAAWLTNWRARRRSVKRSRRGQCARCGYDLKGI